MNKKHSTEHILNKTDLICFSHLRWGFVFQRPQHLLTRYATLTRVFYFEEPKIGDEKKLHIENASENIFIVTPHLPKGLSKEETNQQLKAMVDLLLAQKNIERYCCLYYTPMALQFSGHLKPELLIYDCMDELSAFKFASPELVTCEKELLQKADLVFTGGHSIYNAKKNLHHNIHPFPSSIDKEHFAQARLVKDEPEDQRNIPHPRFGFFGVIDERFDINLISSVAQQKPHWQFILIGPFAKINTEALPRFSNIHYFGIKDYKQLPQYLAGWDVAVIPFALNESTRFISPTKTPEYLAGGKPVISTPIKDVVTPYGDEKLVHVVSDASTFIAAAEKELSNTDKQQWLKKVDAFLAGDSWDNTWQRMVDLIEDTWKQINKEKKIKEEVYV